MFTQKGSSPQVSLRRVGAIAAATMGLIATMTAAAQAQAPEKEKASTSEAKAEQTLKPGDNGPAVEDLQRRLNAELSPSPSLDIDGAYGDATRAAVSRFQRSQGLEPTGTADALTRRRLGLAPIPVPAVPAPEVVNGQVRPRRPADSLDGPPFVTAKAWVVIDGRTGEVLGGEHESEPLPMASTTKIMTALVALRICEQTPAKLDEIITFSERADRTGGSTAGVHSGEKLPVRELMYGLLLPSGNDAAVAIGEHFGARMASETDQPPLARFIAEMNRVADELGLRETRFANTNGLPAEGHRSSTRDLAALARHALALPFFAQVVSTSRRGCTLVDSEGRKRNVVWTNTNRLLDTEGYDGVKTGTTTAAGACLVASGRRDGDHRIVVVLGATSSDGRYADARNIFRWAWQQRARSGDKR